MTLQAAYLPCTVSTKAAITGQSRRAVCRCSKAVIFAAWKQQDSFLKELAGQGQFRLSWERLEFVRVVRNSLSGYAALCFIIHARRFIRGLRERFGIYWNGNPFDSRMVHYCWAGNCQCAGFEDTVQHMARTLTQALFLRRPARPQIKEWTAVCPTGHVINCVAYVCVFVFVCIHMFVCIECLHRYYVCYTLLCQIKTCTGTLSRA